MNKKYLYEILFMRFYNEKIGVSLILNNYFGEIYLKFLVNVFS